MKGKKKKKKEYHLRTYTSYRHFIEEFRKGLVPSGTLHDLALISVLQYIKNSSILSTMLTSAEK